jgi:hypothetical protein
MHFMILTRSRALRFILVVAACASNASTFAQSVPTPSMPGLPMDTGKSIQQRLYSGAGGMFTGQQNHTPVQMGTSANGAAPSAPAPAMWPAIGQIPNASAAPPSNVGTLGAPGSIDARQAPQGLYTAPEERDPLSRFAP